jgi:hypothetical protein
MECARDRLESKRLCATVNGQILMRRLAARFKSRCQLSLGTVVAVFLQANMRTDWKLGSVLKPASPVLLTLSRLCSPHHCSSYHVRQETPCLRIGRELIIYRHRKPFSSPFCQQKHKTRARARVHATLSQPGPAPLPSTLLVAHLSRLHQTTLNYASPEPRGWP